MLVTIYSAEFSELIKASCKARKMEQENYNDDWRKLQKKIKSEVIYKRKSELMNAYIATSGRGLSSIKVKITRKRVL